jgi:diguanylate cyclase (GGDEF)-like protein/PAS domain S-box-containing protein
MRLIDRPGRVLALSVVVAATHSFADSVYHAAISPELSLWGAMVHPATADVVSRTIVLVLVVIGSSAAEWVLALHREIARQLDAERRTLRSLYENNPSAVLGLDRDLHITYANRKAMELVGMDCDDLQGQLCYQAIMGLETPCDGCLVPQVIETGRPHTRVKHEITATGHENWLSQLWYPLTDEAGEVTAVVEIAADVSDVKLDPLTRLPNRLVLRDRLEMALAAARRHDTRLAVLFFDVDRFKEVNDTHGHKTGDELLVALARRMRAVLRQEETLARISGDEFVLLAPRIETAEDARLFGERMLAAVADPFELTEACMRVSLSVGAAVFEGGSATPNDLMHEADSAMYEAKRRGGGRVVVVEVGALAAVAAVAAKPESESESPLTATAS